MELELPLDHSPPPTPLFRSQIHRFEVPTALTQALRSLTRQEGVSLYTTLLTAFKALLYGYSEQSDILVGGTFSHYDRHENEALIGPFANQLLLRTRLDAGMTFRAFLHRVRDTVMDALEHADLPLDRLIASCESAGISPAFPRFRCFSNSIIPVWSRACDCPVWS